ncbi:MAG: S-methyl-5-thioribose-1-phosphate isomerase [Bacteroidales bacterium]|nr:S-methyl-5-thioribose-1-phosphate isomerase [Bacteroidales bacterium]MDI3480114.1 methylthioribose-phosphate isomerase [Rikenellaceae bacterium]
MRVNNKNYQSVWADFNNKRIYCIDQRALPFRFSILELNNLNDISNAITTMAVRGAPAIGITAAYAIWLSHYSNDGNINLILQDYNRLISLRPTAINLKKGADYVFSAINENINNSQVYDRAIEFVNNEINACYKIGTYGVELIKAIHNQSSNIVNILTHCNAGWLACGDYGTALAPIFEANKQNIPIHVWVDETRPLNQGSRLTAWELYNEKIPFSVITDNTGGLLMMKHNVDMIIIGADRIARNGDVANKIGSYLKALAAAAHSIPFYVAAPISTFDFSLYSGDDIPIEQRHSSEIQSIQSFYNDEWISSELFPPDYQSINYAFDITPAKFINSFITEKGIYKNINDLIKQGKYNKNRQS